ncbi:lipid A biosynthesis acyltransferase [Fulvivirga sp. RKSG066]|uniref:lysophospholipid acyltransferase family protein n=1 Tax=Fulvivirga aurantia TaxID=2529383 RepID=UPI0012BC131F|nr:lysophospholipid acyltransferase family protein [Fulvivirga aurantia]MTI21109.1 lipid A biosynthesis acyltransferase [Fulvivirga aurantia]
MRYVLYQLLFGFLNAISRLPFWVLHRVSDAFYVLIYYVVGYRKKMVLKNIKRSFPEKTEKEARAIRKKFYKHFTDLLIESVKSATLSQKQFQKRYFIVNQAMLDTYYQEGKSVIILSPHTGNWEWVFSLVHVLPYKVYAVYQRLTNPYMDAYIRKTRQRYGAVMIPTSKAFATVTSATEAGEQSLTWMAADQACKPAKAQWVNFLNQDTTFHKGFEALARETNQTVLFLDIKKVKRSYYELELHVITEDPNVEPDGKIVEEFARLTEQRIKADPAYWLWSHNRWKHRREG